MKSICNFPTFFKGILLSFIFICFSLLLYSQTPPPAPCDAPTVTGHTDGELCGTGQVEISATASQGTIRWFIVPVAYDGETPVGTSNSGENWNTPSISSTTTYYAEAYFAECPSEERTAVIATIIDLPNITADPSDDAKCPGTGTSFSITASGTGITYQWQENNVNLSDAGVYSNVTTATLNISDVAGLDGKQYRCIVSGTCTPAATSASATLTVNVPSAPVATAATNIHSSYFTANWNSVPGATKYFIDVSELSNFSTFVAGYEDLDVGLVLSKDITGLSANTDYFFRVRTFNGCISDNSNTISAKTSNSGIPGLWVGITNDWNTGTNWDDGNVPTSGVPALIPTNPTGGYFPIVSNAASCGGLTLEPLANIIINTGHSLTVNGDLLLSSDVNGTAALIDNGTLTVTGTATLQRYITAGANYYHHICSPVAGATLEQINDDITIKNPNGNYYNTEAPPNSTTIPNIWKYDEKHTHNVTEDQNGWIAPSGLETMETMRGYTLLFPGTTMIDFITTNANFNTGTKNISLTKYLLSSDNAHNYKTISNRGKIDAGGTYVTDGPSSGWNFVGNPYPSPIDWDAVAPSLTNIEPTLYMFIPSTPYGGNYGYYNGITHDAINATRYIPMMQGFFIHTTATENLVFDNSHRTVAAAAMNQSFYKKNATDKKQISLTAFNNKNNTFRDQTKINFDEMGTLQFDSKYDAYKLMNTDPEYPNLYSKLADNTNIAINTLPLSEENIIIPLGFNASSAGLYTIEAEEINNISGSVYLEDKVTGTNWDLSLSSEYKFSYNPSLENTDRFYLRLINNTSDITTKKNEQVNIYSESSNIIINYFNPDNKTALVSIYNAEGKLINTSANISNGINRININQTSGVYLVRIINSDKVYNQKVFINK